MIEKWFGCGLLLAAALSASVIKIRKEKRRLEILEGWIDFLALAKREIEYRTPPLPLLLEKTDRSFLELLGAGEKSLECYLALSEKDLDKESFDALSAFAAAFGTSLREDLTRACERALSTLTQKRQKLAAELPKKKRQTLSVSLLAACLAILLLW